MNQIPPSVQMSMARSYVRDIAQQAVDNLKHMPEFIRGIARADANKNDILSGAELAAAVARTENMITGLDLEKVRKIGCTSKDPEVAKILDESIDIANFSVARRLHVLNNPKDVTHQADEMAQRWKIVFSQVIGVSVNRLAPETSEYIDRASKDLSTLANHNMIKAHQGLLDRSEIGALPRQVTPMTAQQLCAALNSI
jgi:hypothetical protein